MRDRLIELIKEADKKCNDTKQCENCIGFGKGNECVNYLIADHLLASGVIVPPCKVGDTVYMPAIWYKQVNSYIVVEINLGAGNNNAVVLDEYVGGFVLHRSQAVYFNQFGKTVFLTKEEAEKTLKGANNEKS